MSGPFPLGGPGFPPPYNYGGQYIPQFQGNPSFNNGMMPQQPPVQQHGPMHQAPFQQHRPPPFHSPMPPNPNQVHFANANTFHHNTQFPQSPYLQGPMQQHQPPPQYYNYAPYGNNVPGPAYNSLPPNAAFNTTPMTQISHTNPPQNIAMIPHTPQPIDTPVQPTFSSQHVSGSEDLYVQPRPNKILPDNGIAPATQLADDMRDYDPEDLVTTSHPQENGQDEPLEPSAYSMEHDRARDEIANGIESARQPAQHDDLADSSLEDAQEVVQDKPQDQDDTSMSRIKANLKVPLNHNDPDTSQVSSQRTEPNEAQNDILMDDVDNQSTSTQPSPQTPPNQLVDEDRESFRLLRRGKARQALKELHNQSVGFEVLSLEEIDQGLLGQLYQEADLSFDSRRFGITKDNLHTQRVDASAISVVAQEVHPTKKQQDPPSQPYSPPETPLQKPSKEDHPSTSSQDIQPLNSAKSPPNLSEPQKKVAPITDKKPTAPVAGDRKDYIARLLAAKAGIKSDPVPDRPKSEMANSEPQVSPPRDTDSVPQNTTQKATTTEQKRSETKDSKQTELIRQRLEALKKNSKAPLGVSSQPSIEPIRAPPAVTQPPEKMNIDKAAPSPSVRAVGHKLGLQNVHDFPVSFFAPSTRTVSGNLPGLPGLSNSPFPPDSPLAAQEEAQDLTNDNLNAHDIEEVGEEGEIMSEDEKTPAHAITQDPIQQSAPAPTPEAIKPIIIADTVNEPRKRPIAADFIDSPPTKAIKRTISADPIPLVIEVSDNEDEVSVLETQKKTLQQEAIARNSEPRSVNEKKPTLADDPSVPTPSIKSTELDLNATGKITKMNNPLAQHEEKIRIMRLKIADVESRRKAKTPVAAALGTSPGLSPGGNNLALAKNVDAKQQAIKEVNEQLEEREKALASARREVQEKMEAERRHQARIAALAEKERHEATLAATRKEWEERLARRAALEAALPNLDIQIHAARKKLELMKKQEEELKAEIERGNEGRKKLLDELKSILESLEADNVKSLSSPRQDDEVIVLEESERGSAQSRKSPTRSKSPGVTQLPKISIPDLPTAKSKGSINTPQTARTEPTAETMDLASSSEDEGQIIDSNWNPNGISRQPPVEVQEYHESEDHPGEESMEEYEPAIARFSPEIDHDQPISRTPEEGTEYTGNEDYEPTLDIDTIPADPASFSVSKSSMPSGASEEPKSATNSGQSSYEGNTTQQSGHTSRNPSMSRSSVEEGEVHDASEAFDDYEPPEPSMPVEISTSKPYESSNAYGQLPGLSQEPDAMDLDTSNAEAAPPVIDTDLDSRAASAKDDEGETPVHAEPISLGRFTPYESPLRQFLSYRFHPKYVEEVPGGFQSLTYNHKIKPSETMCRWELAGGICNDSSCEYQHFRDLPLTDNNLLLQLGSVHEGTTQQEKEAYINGLKQMIAGMRDKNLRNVSQIASEISGYRSRFLADPTRVLTNL